MTGLPDGVGVTVAVEVVGNGRIQPLTNLFCSDVLHVFRIEVNSPNRVSIHVLDQSDFVHQLPNHDLFLGERPRGVHIDSSLLVAEWSA